MSTEYEVIFVVSWEKVGLFRGDYEYPLRQHWEMLAKSNFQN